MNIDHFSSVFLGVERSHKEGQWVEEMQYEVMGIEMHGNSLITEAPRKGREASILQVYTCTCTYT